MKNNIRRDKYHKVLKVTNDPKLARAARSWSYKRINDIYGIKSPVNKQRYKPTDYNKQRRIKYNFVLNATGDVDLARIARSWSLERIEGFLGLNTRRKYRNRTVTILERPPKKVKLTKRQREYRRKRYGIPPIYDGGSGGGVPIPPPIPPPIPTGPFAGPTDKLDFNDLKKYEFSKDKIDNWADWSQNKNHPKQIKLWAEAVNRSEGKEKDDSYGYAVVYYMYTEEMTSSDVKRHITPHRTIVDFYEDNLRHLL